MRYAMASLALLATIAAAAPDDSPWKGAGVLDPWGQYGTSTMRMKRGRAHPTQGQLVKDNGTISRIPLHSDELKALAKRITLQDFKNHLPGCSDEDDPSYAPNIPDWDINAGVKVPLDDDETCYDGSTCWNDYLLVEAAIEYASWQPNGGAVNCDGTTTCSSAETNLQQTCSTVGTTESSGYDYKVIDASIKLEFGKTVAVDVGTSYTISKSTTDFDLNQVCATAGSVQTCNWEPDTSEGADNCHQAWYADRVLHVWAQAQRMCKKSTKKNVQQNTWGGELCVRGQKEFDFVLPINKLVHCNGKCNDNDPGLATPPNGPREPYQQPADWESLHLRDVDDA